MIFKILRALVALVLVTPFHANAEEPCKTKIASYQEALRCAEQKSPEVQTALLEVERAKAEFQGASQWKNPEFAADSVHGSGSSGNVSETEISLGVPIEFGGKRAARKSLAEASIAQAEAALLQARITARGEALLKLHRFRQALHELEVVEESITTFTKLVARYEKRPQLSPEQEMSSTVFRMTKSDYQLKKVTLLDETATLRTYIETHLNADSESLKKNLPPPPKTWPTLNENLNPAGSPQAKSVQAKLKGAQAELNLAKGEAWPTLFIGPSLKIQNEAGLSTQLYGVNLRFDLPVFNLNGPAKAAATKDLKIAEIRKDFAIFEQERLFEQLQQTYKTSVETLNAMLSHREIEQKHTTIERLFLKGVVPSSLVIEAHRSFVELEQSRNERELKTLEAWIALSTLTGQMPEVAL